MKRKLLKIYYKLFGKRIIRKIQKRIWTMMNLRHEFVQAKLEYAIILAFKSGLSEKERKQLISLKENSDKVMKNITQRIIFSHKRVREVESYLK